MSKRVTTRFSEPLLKLIVNKALKEKKTISETVAELAAASILSSENDDIHLLAKNLADLSSSFSFLKNEFEIHEVTSRREFQMILNGLILINEVAKRVLSPAEYEAAWVQYEKKQEEYTATNRIRF